MSSEIELKFRIPAARLAAVRRAVATCSAQIEALAAVYLDTAADHLAQARVALRLRREGLGATVVWVQTLKAEGASPMQRLEHNVALPGAGRPALDIARHDGSPAGAALARVLAEAGGAPLVERYTTNVQRTRRVLRHGGAQIELALDEGHISAGQRQLPICEIEFELLRGTPQALLDLAARWVDRFGLVLDVRSKSERGHWLAHGLSVSQPTTARPLRLGRQASPAQALAAMLANPLGQVLANASQLAAGADPAGWAQSPAGPTEAEHLHQLRVGLRRLRSVLRVFAPPVDAGLAPALASLFAQLGAVRERDAMAQWLWPALRAAGAPLVEPPAPADGWPDIATLLCAPATQRLWLALLAACHSADGPPGAAPTPLRLDPLRAPLRRLHRQVQRDAERFAGLDDAARHRLRRRIKRLRYAVELVACLWPAKATLRYLRRLQEAQAPLGDYHDTVAALAQYRALAAADPRAWFAVGWLSARQEAALAPCHRALRPLADPGFTLPRHRR